MGLTVASYFGHGSGKFDKRLHGFFCSRFLNKADNCHKQKNRKYYACIDETRDDGLNYYCGKENIDEGT